MPRRSTVTGFVTSYWELIDCPLPQMVLSSRPYVYRPQLLHWKLDGPADPKVAQAKLAGLRRDYAKKVKELRLQYIHEVELQREDKRRKDEAKREAARRAQAEIKASKAAAAQARAAERKVFEEEFRQTLES
ncbi:hypothetical protein CK203_049141 [Vitis vinifera]|uniref:Uncharacterized protein n=1 Tax=Vitis vinifera TaxID=29760 RepID=A0A438GV69_VITVI|nr:hypothetical protein CK203_049141 [Vitis vinifera]